jgi:cell wall-associated NlpC family hydrolase
MTPRAFGVVAVVVVLTATLAGCAGEKHSAVGTRSSIHRLRAQEAAREAGLKAKTEARLRAIARAQGPGPRPWLPRRIHGTGTGHPEAAKIALRYLGVPYVWGGASPSGLDSSGLVKYVYSQLGMSLPHYTVSQWNMTRPISTARMKPGDLVFFDAFGNVGIYIGHGQFVDAPHTGAVVRIESLAARRSSLVGVGRVP